MGHFRLLPIILVALGFSRTIKTQTAELDQNLFKKIELFEQYAAAAYCPSNTKNFDTTISCAASNCPMVEAAKPSMVLSLSNSPETDVHGFIAHDATNNATIISFRGSETWRNWKANVDVRPVEVSICKGCYASRGFWTSWNESRLAVLAAVNETSRNTPAHRIVTVGHSLGGAIATLAAAELRHMGLVVDLYTFGSPRVANPLFARMIESQSPTMGLNHRITHLNDPVPAVPLIAMGFSHIGPEFYISLKSKIPVQIKNITIFSETDGIRGNGQFYIWDTDAHGWYFNAITQCYEDTSAPKGVSPRSWSDMLSDMGFFSAFNWTKSTFAPKIPVAYDTAAGVVHATKSDGFTSPSSMATTPMPPMTISVLSRRSLRGKTCHRRRLRYDSMPRLG